ncbi:MAG: oligosaccharide flippase family protein [Anaerolineales bacterium]|nr:oligosaccharide flippase family protein [Anaerolineales bacterium]
MSEEAVITVQEGTAPRRFAVNVGSNLLMLGLTMLSGIWFTQYLIENLGVALYGIVPLALSVTNYMNVINSSLNSSVGRFLTIDLNHGDHLSANRTFNTALWLSIVVCLLLLPVVLVVSYLAPLFFNVPPGSETAVRFLFVGVMLAYLISIVRSIFNVSPFAHHRFDLQNAVLATNLIIRVGLAVILFTLLMPTLWFIGVGSIAGALISTVLAIVIWRYLTPELKIGLHFFDREQLGKLAGMSGWVLVTQVGALLFLNIDLVVANLRLGAEVTGQYGSVLQWHIMLRMLATTATSVLAPIIIAQYAHNNLNKMASLTRRSVKLLGLGLAFPIGIVAGLSHPLLNIWLGPEFTHLALLLTILVIHLCVNTAVLPLFSVQAALNRVRIPGIVTLVLGILNLILAWWWAPYNSIGIGIALAGALILTLKNTIFTPLYGAYIQDLPWHTFLTSLVPGVLGTLCITAAAFFIGQYFQIDSWIKIGVVGAIVGLIYGGAAFVIALSKEDRQFLTRFLPRLVNSQKI